MSKVKGRILRLVIPAHEQQFVPTGMTEPSYLALVPSSEDKEQAKTLDVAVRWSVWDRDLTKRGQAITHRTSSKPANCYDAEVADLLTVASGHAYGVRVRVVPDPCDPLHPAIGGCDGHCGVEGLDRLPDMQKNDWKALLVDLAKKFVPA